MQDLYDRLKYFGIKVFNLVIIVAALVMFSSWAAKANAHDQMVEEQIAAAERAANRGDYTTDGTFEGSAQGYGGPVKMQVVIENGYIESVTILDASKEDEAWLDMCVGLPDEIVKAQTTSIDVVSGATYTSAGILNGTTEALQKSLAGEAS
ncbi:MAG: FMN-binding protein [Eggerthellaceae bacterium]|nr:FMN-binding protein [Eggerthellaceae bacterium]